MGGVAMGVALDRSSKHRCCHSDDIAIDCAQVR